MFESFKSAWQARSGSEQRTLTLAAIALLAMVFYGLVWSPLDVALNTNRSAISTLQEQVSWMQQASQQFSGQRNGNATPNSSTQSLLALADRSLRSNKLADALERIQPDGNSKVRVWLKDAPLDQTLLWLAELQNQHGISADALGIERADGGNKANLRATFSRGL